jgi:hypothetical protein
LILERNGQIFPVSMVAMTRFMLPSVLLPIRAASLIHDPLTSWAGGRTGQNHSATLPR